MSEGEIEVDGKNGLGRVGVLAGFGALAVSTCCILPLTLMFFGTGMSLMAVFGKISAFSFPVIGVALFLLAVAWFKALKGNAPAKTKYYLVLGSALTAISFVLVISESQINDWIISFM